MGNSNCNNAVPCLGSETLQDSPNRSTRPGKRGVTAKNWRKDADAAKRSIDNLMMESRETGQSMKSLRSTEQMLNYGIYQMADETGMPQHYLLDSVDCSSSNADSGIDSQSVQHLRRDLYASQRTSLFEEFVDQTEMNFSQSEFDKSISLIEFTI